MAFDFYTEKEQPAKEAIETLMDIKIPIIELPEELEISKKLTLDEQPRDLELHNSDRKEIEREGGSGFHEKKDKNKKINLGGSYRRIIKKKPSNSLV